MAFADNLKALPPVSHLAALELLDPAGTEALSRSGAAAYVADAQAALAVAARAEVVTCSDSSILTRSAPTRSRSRARRCTRNRRDRRVDRVGCRLARDTRTGAAGSDRCDPTARG